MSSSTPSHHTANHRFRNPPGSPVREGSAGEMLGFIMNQLFSSFKTPIPSDHVLGGDEFRRQLAQARNPSVTWLGHSAFIIRLGGKIILTDPFLGETAGPAGFGPKRFVAAPITGAELPKADVLLVSHNHYDHLDAPTIEAYPYKADIQVIVPLGLGAFFTSRGYSKVIEQDWWESWHSGALKISTLLKHFTTPAAVSVTRTKRCGPALASSPTKAASGFRGTQRADLSLTRSAKGRGLSIWRWWLSEHMSRAN
ncbi:MBL fold metallo-hydrolase [Phaeobacter sp. BS52]|uniref:MBL fold metallo-hydrolase n=1 Tax=Phaeobacter sp. BS52 TaxID=2907241 RepID=UPI00386E8D47